MEQFTQEMLKRLDALAGKLGMAATALWGFYLRQAKVEGITDLIGLLLAVGVFFYLNHWRAQCWTKYTTIYSDQLKHLSSYTANGDGWGIGTAATVAGMVLSLLAIVLLLHSALTEFFNPGYWAFQAIVGQLKGQ